MTLCVYLECDRRIKQWLGRDQKIIILSLLESLFAYKLVAEAEELIRWYARQDSVASLIALPF